MTLHYNRHKEREKRRTLRQSSTSAEEELWTHLRGNSLGIKFRRQYSVDTYVLDFYAPQWKLAIEVDGPIHSSDDAHAYDTARTELLNRFGICVLRFTNDEVMRDIAKVLQRIEEAGRRKMTSP